MKDINQFIKELQTISEEKRKLPLVIACPNGLLVEPNIKMCFDENIMFVDPPDKMIITWQ